MNAEIRVGDRVRVTLDADSPFYTTKWFPRPGVEVTGTVQRVFKNGKVAVAVDQLPNVGDGGDGLRTLHFAREEVTR